MNWNDFLTEKFNNGWDKLMSEEFTKPYFRDIENYLDAEEQSGTIVYPHKEMLFKAFELTPPDKVKVVILGQDPYHGEGQAMGLSFSVPNDVKMPPSLRNIFKELYSDLGQEQECFSSDLTPWAEQGVLLLNSILTVRAGKPASHRKIGWQTFTDEVIRKISENMNGVVFMLWGNYARGKKNLIDEEKHCILEAAHPSPLARGAFFGSKHFSKANNFLISCNKTPIDWSLPIIF